MPVRTAALPQLVPEAVALADSPRIPTNQQFYRHGIWRWPFDLTEGESVTMRGKKVDRMRSAYVDCIGILLAYSGVELRYLTLVKEGIDIGVSGEGALEICLRVTEHEVGSVSRRRKRLICLIREIIRSNWWKKERVEAGRVGV